MRRAVAASFGSAVGLVALLHYKTVPSASASRPLATTVPSTAAPTTTPPTTTAPTTTQPERRVDGPVVTNRYGPVQVEVTLRGSTIVDVQALQLPRDRSRSADISNRAAPILRSEVLAANGTQIDTVSGATYTTTGYIQSLQAALDQARR
jgi:uncharacterized protein with FMN-binding domain